MLRRGLLLATLIGVLAPGVAHAGVQLATVGTFSAPTYVAAPPADTSRLFVVEQSGTIRILVDGVNQATPFLDIQSEVRPPGGGEQGLLSLAFAPDYASSGKFYVYYTSRNCDVSGGCDEHVSEFSRSPSNPNVSDPSSEHVLLDIPHPNYTNHNGGQLQFGPDGDLYISVGDGGGSNDSGGNAQRTDRLLGKILRISPETTSYSIPDGNPYKGSGLCSSGSNGGSNCPEIWAYGLRNPWRFSFDGMTGDLVIGEVGQSDWEEIDFAHRGQDVGGNYGWPCYEGFELNALRPGAECSPLPSPVVSPVLAYPHPGNCGGAPFCGTAVIGGYVMHDPSLPSLDGCYVYGDLGNHNLRVARLAQPSALGDANLGPQAQVSALSTFGQDASGHLYAASVDGPVYRLDPDGNASTDPTCPAAPGGTGGGGGGGGTAGTSGTTDKTPPIITLRLPRRVRILRTRAISARVSVNERSTVIGTATVNVGHAARVLRFKKVTRTLAAGRQVTLKLRPSKRTLALLRKALRRRRSFVARVSFSARDAAGNVGRRRPRSVRLVR